MVPKADIKFGEYHNSKKYKGDNSIMKTKGSLRRKGQEPLECGVFAVYRGDKNIEDGTYDYIRKKYNLSHDMIKYYCSNSYHERVLKQKRNIRKYKEPAFELVRIDTVEEDNIFGND